jgi:hypothetical protein
MNGTRSSPGMARPVADTMPAVTLFSNVNGEPMASTHSPGRSFDGSPSRTTGRSLPSILMTATSVRLSTPDDLRGVFAPVSRAHGDVIRIGDHVRIGEDVTIGADDEARAFTLARLRFEATTLRTVGHAEAAEEFLDGIIRLVRGSLGYAVSTFHHGHVDDGRTYLLHERREIRQRSAIESAYGLGLRR